LGIKILAVAIIRTSSSGSTGSRSPSGVPDIGASALTGTLSGCGSRLASVASIAQRSSIDSPIPMMPPEQTVMPALRTVASVWRRSS
jgi:hypothetical protein